MLSCTLIIPSKSSFETLDEMGHMSFLLDEMGLDMDTPMEDYRNTVDWFLDFKLSSTYQPAV